MRPRCSAERRGALLAPPDPSRQFLRPGPAVRRRYRRRRMGMRDGRKAEGAPFSECAVNPRASASGHVAATPLRSLHAHGAGARGITTGSPKSAGSGCHNALPASRRRPPVPAPAARGPSPRPPARGGGMRAARRAPHTCFAGRRSAEGAPFSSVPCIQHRRRAATSPRCRRAACTTVARLLRAIDASCPRWVA